jgi:GAF domain-containing protein
MPFDTHSGFHRLPVDADLPKRRLRLLDLGLGGADGELDALATELAKAADAPYAMINLITDRQFFAGLHCPDDVDRSAIAPAGPQPVQVGRTMPRDYGYCPEVLHRTKALVLPDVCDSPRFHSNRVVDKLGIRTYAGAPLIDEEAGITLGTVCFVGTEARPPEEGRQTLALIKDHRDVVMQHIYRRAPRR